MSSFKIKEVLNSFPESKLYGNESQLISNAVGINDALNQDQQNMMSWLSDQKLQSIAPEQLHLGLLILTPSAYEKLKKAACNFLVVENPRATFFKIINTYFKVQREPTIEKTSVIHKTSKVGKNCYIGHHVVIEEDCQVGSNTTILHNTVILRGTIIGDGVIIGCNNTIGNYGFGYEKDLNGKYVVLDHLGKVVIHDGVEIHNNTCIDRGVLGNTEIHENVKIDNLVHIAHGVVIERNSLVIANAMIAGSARIGENSWIAPSVSIKNKATIAANTMTGIGAVVLKDTDENKTYIGNPATTMEEYKKWSETRKKLLSDL